MDADYPAFLAESTMHNNITQQHFFKYVFLFFVKNFDVVLMLKRHKLKNRHSCAHVAMANISRIGLMLDYSGT